MSRWKMIVAATAGVLAVVVGLAALGAGGSGGSDPTRSTSTRSGTSTGAEENQKGSPSETASKVGNDATGSEVIREPEGSAKNGLPGLDRTKPSTKGSLITGRLPTTASRNGAIVAGFPTALLPLPSGSVVRSSGVSSASNVLQVSIVANSSRSPGSILGFFRRALSAHGFAESKAPAIGGSTAAGFSRSADDIVVTVARAGRSTTSYSLFGTLHADKSD
jgi:hypothetical protein